LPPAFGSCGRRDIEYLVAITSSSRFSAMKVPSSHSDEPLVYMLAVSMKLPPRST